MYPSPTCSLVCASLDPCDRWLFTFSSVTPLAWATLDFLGCFSFTFYNAAASLGCVAAPVDRFAAVFCCSAAFLTGVFFAVYWDFTAPIVFCCDAALRSFFRLCSDPWSPRGSLWCYSVVLDCSSSWCNRVSHGFTNAGILFCCYLQGLQFCCWCCGSLCSDLDLSNLSLQS